MITSIKEWKQYNENILVPRNLEGRHDKLRKERIKLLSKEIIEFKNSDEYTADLEIDNTFEGIDNEFVKVKEIYGNVRIDLNYIPSWLKNIKIYGNFDCSWNNLKTLENCPEYIEGSFWCNDNNLTSLEGCPKYIGNSFFCSDNNLTSLEGCPKYIGRDLICFDNKIKLKLPKEVELKGSFIN